MRLSSSYSRPRNLNLLSRRLWVCLRLSSLWGVPTKSLEGSIYDISFVMSTRIMELLTLGLKLSLSTMQSIQLVSGILLFCFCFIDHDIDEVRNLNKSLKKKTKNNVFYFFPAMTNLFEFVLNVLYVSLAVHIR